MKDKYYAFADWSTFYLLPTIIVKHNNPLYIQDVVSIQITWLWFSAKMLLFK